MTAPYLDIAGLSVALRQGGRLLRSASLAVQPGEVHALVGESGAGKSMIARAVFGILPKAVDIVEGEVTLAGQDLARLPETQRRLFIGRRLGLATERMARVASIASPQGAASYCLRGRASPRRHSTSPSRRADHRSRSGGVRWP